MLSESTRIKYRLPVRLFFFTIDQITDMLLADANKFIFKDGHDTGIPPDDKMLARNIAPSDSAPEWRVEEMEFVRWMRHMHIIPPRRH
jgi:hypothetical protein